jgi:sec-independent protein translocase protein TatA
LGVPELLIIMVIILLAFGAGRLFQVGRALGQGIGEFREGTQGLGEGDTSVSGSDESGKA